MAKAASAVSESDCIYLQDYDHSIEEGERLFTEGHSGVGERGEDVVSILAGDGVRGEVSITL